MKTNSDYFNPYNEIEWEAKQWKAMQELKDYWYHVWPVRVLGEDYDLDEVPMPSIADFYTALPESERLNFVDDLRRYILDDSHRLIKELEGYEEYELCADVRRVADSLYKDAFILYMKMERHEFHTEIDSEINTI